MHFLIVDVDDFLLLTVRILNFELSNSVLNCIFYCYFRVTNPFHLLPVTNASIVSFVFISDEFLRHIFPVYDIILVETHNIVRF